MHGRGRHMMEEGAIKTTSWDIMGRGGGTRGGGGHGGACRESHGPLESHRAGGRGEGEGYANAHLGCRLFQSYNEIY